MNLRRALAPLADRQCELVIDALAESRSKLHFLLYGYVVMPDHWHSLIWTTFPLTISRVVQDVKWMAAGSLNRARGTSGRLGNINSGTASSGTASNSGIARSICTSTRFAGVGGETGRLALVQL